MQENIPTVIIIGAGLGGLTLYHALVKNKDKKEFDVKIFERESSPQDRWQGYHIGINNKAAQSLLDCIPSSMASKLPKAMPDSIPEEYNGFSLCDHTGRYIIKPEYVQFKDVYEAAKVSAGRSIIVAYRDRLRDVLLEDVPLQWGKKCIGFEETEEGVWVSFADGSKEFCDILVGADGINSPVRKQKVPELQIFVYERTQIITDVAVPKNLMDRFVKVSGNITFQESIGLNHDVAFTVFRLIPIEQKQNYNEPHYRLTLAYSYPSNLDDNTKVDDNNPESILEYTKEMIRKLRPPCELTDIFLELWELVPKTKPDTKDYPFKTYNPLKRRSLQDIDPLSVNNWTTSRVTLLGDAAHATTSVLGIGANNAILDADYLSQALINYSPENYIHCIKEYENEMLKRNSADVLRSRFTVLRKNSSVGYFGNIYKNIVTRIMLIVNTIKNVFNVRQ